MSTIERREAIASQERDAQALRQIEALLAARHGSIELTSADANGEGVVLPETVTRILDQAVHLLARHSAVAVVSVDSELTTQEAADILNVSRPYLVRLLESGAIPFTKTGAHRRIRLDDLLRYKAVRDVERKQALDELTRLSQEMGLY
ncbi:MAG: helix-turn-helix domain-containing protein, partial [Ktedonobacterales bacterium]